MSENIICFGSAKFSILIPNCNKIKFIVIKIYSLYVVCLDKAKIHHTTKSKK